jgi:Holliday junction resolvase-like predicted endonuclease
VRRAAKRDSNEPAIVEALEQTGWLVHRISDPGMADLICYNPRQQRFALVEVKTRRGKLTGPQVAFHGKWPVTVIRSVDEAIELGRF